MSKISVDTKEVQENLAKLPPAMEDALKQCLEQACLRVVRDAKSECPVGEGTLRNSITFVVEPDEDGNLAGYVGSNIEYAPFVHQGTGIYAVNGDGRKEVPWYYYDEKLGEVVRTYGIHPKPFLQNAVDSNKQALLNDFNDLLKEMGNKI